MARIHLLGGGDDGLRARVYCARRSEWLPCIGGGLPEQSPQQRRARTEAWLGGECWDLELLPEDTVSWAMREEEDLRHTERCHSNDLAIAVA